MRMIGRRATTWLLAAPVLLYGGVATTLYLKQRQILFRPDTTRPDAASAGVPGLTAITLPTQAGLDLLAWWVPPASPDRHVVLYLHGNGGNLSDRADRLGELAASGLGVLMPEYPGYGGNPGQPSETALFDTAKAASSFLAAHGIEDRRVAAYGESLGTGVAVRFAAGRKLAGLVLESPFTSVTQLARDRYWYLPVNWLLRDRFDILSRMPQIRSPVLVAFGEQDDVVPPWMGRAVFAAAPDPKRLWVAPDGGHEDLGRFGLLRAVAEWLNTGMTPSPLTDMTHR